MIGKILFAFFLVAPGAQASAANIDPVKCEADATAALPKSPLLTVKSASTRQMTPAEAKEYPTGPALWVDINVALSGKETAYTYVCAITHAGRVVRESER